jgi:tartrate-resistant acid phosphatase type 5
MIIFVIILLTLDTSGVAASIESLPFGGTIVAFGDWGYQRDIWRLNRVHNFLSQNIRSGNPQDFVCLLGDNFYPSGINPELGHNDPKFRLFTEVLAGGSNLNATFFTTIGNHDYMQPGGVAFQKNYSAIDSRWSMAGPVTSLALRSNETNIRPICVWQIDSPRISKIFSDVLDEAISRQENCTFKIIISHFPVFTFGQYQEDRHVNNFQSLILPILQKHKIHLFLSGHEHSAQLISHSTIPTKFIIAGSPIDFRFGSVRRDINFDKKRNATLEWFHDRTAGIVSRIKYNTTTLTVEFVDIWTRQVLSTTIIDA